MPGGDELVLKPGGYHIMFKNLLKNLKLEKLKKQFYILKKLAR